MSKDNTNTELEQIMKAVLDRDPVDLKEIKKTYALISTPRSGSSMFVDKLKSTGLMGEPLEWFNLRYIKAYFDLTGEKDLNFRKYLQEIMRHTTSETGVFGVNFHVDQFVTLQKRNIDIFDYISFDKIYAIERKNKLAQAFSLSKARVTDVWSTNVALSSGDQQKIENISNSFVLKELQILASWNEIYQESLAAQVDQTFYYEDFSKDVRGSCFYGIFEDLEQKAKDDHTFETRLKRQSNSKDKERIAALENFILGN